MTATGMVVALVVGGASCLGCFSTARYDNAHVQRIASINARYAAEHRRQDERYASLATALEQLRLYLLPIQRDASAPPGTRDEADDITWHRTQAVLRTIDERARALELQRTEAHRRLEAQRRDEIRASEQQWGAEITSGRATRRARLQAAAHALPALGQGPIRAKPICVGTAPDRLSSRTGACLPGICLPGRGASSSPGSQPGADPPAARR